MQQPIGHIFQTLFQHMHEIFLITPTLKQALVSRIIHGNTFIVFFIQNGKNKLMVHTFKRVEKKIPSFTE
jgi:hypothetical protein